MQISIIWALNALLLFPGMSAAKLVIDPASVGMTPKVALAWYAGWHGEEFPLSKVNWSKYTHLNYAFALTTFDTSSLTLNGSNPDLLPEFVSTARAHGVKALVSLGGWTGSRAFSVNVGSEQNRTMFVKTVTDFATKYKLDGLDFDWEYPGRQSIGCNIVNSQDTENFLLFLEQLRKDPQGSRLLLTAAVGITTFVGPDGNSLTDVSRFSQVLDFVSIMNYDVWGSWMPAVGPNAPLNDTCVAPQNQAGSAVSAIQAWNKAGMPLDQLVLGVPAYGRAYTVHKEDAFVQGSSTELAPYPAFDASLPPTGDSWSDAGGVDICGNTLGPGGTVNFWGMVELGYLNSDGSPKEDIAYRFDDCSQTPYAYNPTTEIMVSYDDAKSFAAKGKFIKDSKLRGFAMWEAGGDSKNILLDSLRTAVGLDSGLNSAIIASHSRKKVARALGKHPLSRHPSSAFWNFASRLTPPRTS